MGIDDVPEPMEDGETRTADAGSASRVSQTRGAQSEERPDYDARQDRISDERKPAGPPLPEGDDTESLSESRGAEDDEPPVDPGE